MLKLHQRAFRLMVGSKDHRLEPILNGHFERIIRAIG